MTRKNMCNREVLTLYHYAELDAQAREELERHLLDCSDCREELGRLQELGVRLGQAQEPAPEVLQRLAAGVEAQLSRRQNRLVWSGFTLGGGLAAALLLMLIFRPEAPAPQPLPPASLAGQVEILEQYELLEALEMLEEFELLAEIEDLG